MTWRVRTTLDDRPGILAQIAAACGGANINIIGMQVFPSHDEVTDEFIVTAPSGLTDVEIAQVFSQAGGKSVAVTRIEDEAVTDTPTRYLRGVHQILEEGRDIEGVLRELLDTAPPDVADYAGHDVLDLTRRNGSTLRISRAVPFTPIERARAQALLSLVSDAGHDVPLISPSSNYPLPIVRVATLADIDAVAALHARSSVKTLYNRYQIPLRMPMTTRMARRLVLPDDGIALVVQIGLDLVGHGILEPDADRWTFQLIIEDAWQARGLGSMLIKQAAGRAKGLGADHLTFITVGSNDTLLRAVGSAGFVARVERHDGNVYITVPLVSAAPILD